MVKEARGADAGCCRAWFPIVSAKVLLASFENPRLFVRASQSGLLVGAACIVDHTHIRPA